MALARELALIESPSNRPETQGPVFDRLAEVMAEAGLRTRRLEGRVSGGQLYAAPARPRPPGAQLIIGHVDTVWPVGTLADMPVELRDGKLHGPGVYDMKAGLVLALHAGARNLLAAIFNVPRQINI